MAPNGREAARRARLLEVAIDVFVRFGFRKTSMDEVARAADISRQGLYLHFSTKEALFEAALQHFLQGVLADVDAKAADASRRLDEKLLAVFDAWVGRFVGMPASAADLVEVARALKPMTDAAEAKVLEHVVRLIRGGGLVAAHKALGVSARQLADSLNATARGLKASARSRAEFVDAMRVAVSVMCAPLEVER